VLIQPDKSALGDGKLANKEAVAKVKEENRATVAKDRIPDQDLLENRQAALGRPMQPNDLILRIQKLNREIFVGKGGVKDAVKVCVPRLVDGEIQQKYITGFYIDNPLPEFSCVVVDHRGLPVREVRGWRSVLMALWKCGSLNLKQIETEFGRPSGMRSVLWDKQTQKVR
jgi:hypothetical protein